MQAMRSVSLLRGLGHIDQAGGAVGQCGSDGHGRQGVGGTVHVDFDTGQGATIYLESLGCVLPCEPPWP